ncbi:MAG: hypothetical protein WAT12_10255, partial [Candidatus Nitrotoga sp.]
MSVKLSQITFPPLYSTLPIQPSALSSTFFIGNKIYLQAHFIPGGAINLNDFQNLLKSNPNNDN